MIYIIIVTCFFQVAANIPAELSFLSDHQLKNLATIDETKLPRNIQNVIRNSRSNPDEDNWCCKVTPTKTIVTSASEQVTIVVYEQNRQYTSCGFLWLSRCTKYYFSTRYKPVYQITYQSRLVPTTCPDDQLTCCKGYVMIADHCLPIDRLKDIHQDLIDLHGQGVIG